MAKSVYSFFRQRLEEVYEPREARAIALMVFDGRFGLSTADVYAGKDEQLGDAERQELERLLVRLLHHEPVQYVLGTATFCGHPFRVRPGVLIPRPETEELCGWMDASLPIHSSSPTTQSVPSPTIQSVPSLSTQSVPSPTIQSVPSSTIQSVPSTRLRLLDLCCGSGCIAVTMKLWHPDWQVTALDISKDAVEVTAENARALGAEVEIVQADVLALSPHALNTREARRDNADGTGSDNAVANSSDNAVANSSDNAVANSSDNAVETGGYFDIVVSNPPYVCQSERKEMAHNVLDYEPSLALFVPDEDPLLFYRAITRHASQVLRDGGQLFFEVNARYARETAQLLRNAAFSDVEVRRDMNGKERMVKGRKKES